MPDNSLTSLQLIKLADQLERDRSLGWQELQSRDYAIGRHCQHNTAKEQLLCWLNRVAPSGSEQRPAETPTVSDSTLGFIITAGFFVLGVATMAGFLFTHSQGLINVLWFFAFFVLLQLALCLLSGITLGMVLTGNSSASFTLNPARLVYSRALPDRRYLSEFQSIFQLIFMRYGQSMGIGFMAGALTAFLLILAVNDFSFVWSSTFNLSNAAVQRFADIAAVPWAHLLPEATVDAQVIADSRYHPGAAKFSPEQIRSMHSWWPFLFASMLCYALLPRILLWILSRYLYASRLKRAFVTYPGADLVLRRMTQPAVHTQAHREQPRPEQRSRTTAPPRDDVLVVSWGGAIADQELDDYAELGGIAPQRLALAGLSLEGDQEALALAAQEAIGLVLLVVKSWEPPMSDLADFIAELGDKASCVLFLKPLKGGAVDDNARADWQLFAGQLERAEVPIQTLTLCSSTLHRAVGSDREDP